MYGCGADVEYESSVQRDGVEESLMEELESRLIRESEARDLTPS